MFAQLITSGTGAFNFPTAPCIGGESPHPSGVCFESGGEPVGDRNCIDNGGIPTGGCFFGDSPS